MLILCAVALLVAIDNAVGYSWYILIKIFNNIKFTTKFNYLRSQILLVNLYLELNLKSKNRVNCEFELLENRCLVLVAVFLELVTMELAMIAALIKFDEKT